MEMPGQCGVCLRQKGMTSWEGSQAKATRKTECSEGARAGEVGLSKPLGAQEIKNESKMPGIELQGFDLHCWTWVWS